MPYAALWKPGSRKWCDSVNLIFCVRAVNCNGNCQLRIMGKSKNQRHGREEAMRTAVTGWFSAEVVTKISHGLHEFHQFLSVEFV